MNLNSCGTFRTVLVNITNFFATFSCNIPNNIVLITIRSTVLHVNVSIIIGFV